VVLLHGATDNGADAGIAVPVAVRPVARADGRAHDPSRLAEALAGLT
jgi:hypothetical protein